MKYFELIKIIYLKIQCRSHGEQRVQSFFLNVCDIITQFFVARVRAIFYLPRVFALMSNEILTFRTYIERYSLYYKHYSLKRLSDILHIKNMNGNNNRVVQIFSINVNSDQDYQRYASRRKSSVVREISGRIHSVLNRDEEEDVDSSVDGVFRLRGQIDIKDVVPSDSQPTVEAQHFQRRGSSLTNG